MPGAGVPGNVQANCRTHGFAVGAGPTAQPDRKMNRVAARPVPTNVRRRGPALFERESASASSRSACDGRRTFVRRDELRLCERAVPARQPERQFSHARCRVPGAGVPGNVQANCCSHGLPSGARPTALPGRKMNRVTAWAVLTNVRRRGPALFERESASASSRSACDGRRTFVRRDELRLCERAVPARQPERQSKVRQLS